MSNIDDNIQFLREYFNVNESDPNVFTTALYCRERMYNVIMKVDSKANVLRTSIFPATGHCLEGDFTNENETIIHVSDAFVYSETTTKLSEISTKENLDEIKQETLYPLIQFLPDSLTDKSFFLSHYIQNEDKETSNNTPIIKEEKVKKTFNWKGFFISIIKKLFGFDEIDILDEDFEEYDFLKEGE